MTKEEIEAVFEKVFKDMPYIGPIGNGWYKMGDAYGGREAYLQFLKGLKDEIRKTV